MAIDSGDTVTVPTPGTPVAAVINIPNTGPPQDRKISCHGILFQALPTNLGMVYVGKRSMSVAGGTGIFARLGVPTANLIPSFSVAITIAPNALTLNEFYIDADNPDEGVNVTYLVL